MFNKNCCPCKYCCTMSSKKTVNPPPEFKPTVKERVNLIEKITNNIRQPTEKLFDTNLIQLLGHITANEYAVTDSTEDTWRGIKNVFEKLEIPGVEIVVDDNWLCHCDRAYKHWTDWDQKLVRLHLRNKACDDILDIKYMQWDEWAHRVNDNILKAQKKTLVYICRWVGMIEPEDDDGNKLHGSHCRVFQTIFDLNLGVNTVLHAIFGYVDANGQKANESEKGNFARNIREQLRKFPDLYVKFV